MERICRNCQILFSGKNKKKVIDLSSAESTQSVVRVKEVVAMLYVQIFLLQEFNIKDIVFAPSGKILHHFSLREQIKFSSIRVTPLRRDANANTSDCILQVYPFTAVDSRYPNTDNSNYCKSQSKSLGPVVQSVVSLTSLLVVKMLTVLVSTISNSQEFLLKKCE